MRKDEQRALAEARMARVAPVVHPGTARWSVAEALAPSGNIGLELGVAAGGFAARMVATGRFDHYFGVDAYGDQHNTREYKKALVAAGLDGPCRILRLTFDQALDLFPDGLFDFIYVDGYAHTGEEGGRTLVDWLPKLKPGGVMAGDDYDLAEWPLVVWAVNDFVAQLGVTLNVTSDVSDAAYSKYPSWWIVTPQDLDPARVQLTPELVEVADTVKAQVAATRLRKQRARRAGSAEPVRDTLPRES